MTAIPRAGWGEMAAAGIKVEGISDAADRGEGFGARRKGGMAAVATTGGPMGEGEARREARRQVEWAAASHRESPKARHLRGIEPRK